MKQSLPSDENLLSQTIAWLRFPLIVLVVFIHVVIPLPTGIEPEQLPFANTLCINFTKEGIARVAVPLFFFIAGFLYFYKTEWGIPAYFKKVKSRTQTLLVPFITWSIIAAVYVLSVQKLGMKQYPILSEIHSLWDWLLVIYKGSTLFYAPKDSSPLAFVFWFIRDLFLVGLLSPLWHFLLRKQRIGTFFLIGIGLFWFLYQGPQISGLGLPAIFFFCAGAFFSIHGKDFSKIFSKLRIPASIIYVGLLLCDTFTKSYVFNHYIHDLMIIFGIISFIAWIRFGICTGKLKENKFLSEASFFVYAGHACYFLRGSCTVLLERFYTPTSSSPEFVLLFFTRAAFEIGVCLIAYWLLKRYLPWTLRFLTGGR